MGPCRDRTWDPWICSQTHVVLRVLASLGHTSPLPPMFSLVCCVSSVRPPLACLFGQSSLCCHLCEQATSSYSGAEHHIYILDAKHCGKGVPANFVLCFDGYWSIRCKIDRSPRYSAVPLIYTSLIHGFGYNMVMIWLPIIFTMEFYKGIIGK